MQTADTPLVSVITTTYNRADRLKDMIQSVINQTYTNWELILIDDASTDNTADIVSTFNDQRIRYHKLKKNCHICEAANTGLSLASGDLIARLDSDDRWKPEKLEKQVQYMQAHPECGACLTLVEFFGPEHIDFPMQGDLFQVENKTQEEWLQQLYFHRNFFCHSSSIYRKSLLNQGYNLALCMLHDYDLWVQLLKKAPIYIFQEPLTLYFWDNRSNASSQTDEHTEQLYYESSYLRSHFFDDMDDDLFRRTFQPWFQNPDSSTPQELACEKAFLLFLRPDGNFLPHRFAGAELVARLLNDPATHALLEEKFHFTQKDFYNQTQTPFWGTPFHVAKQMEQVKADLNESRLQNEQLRGQLQHAADQASDAQNRLNAIVNSTSWKVTSPLRRLMDLFKH